MAMDISRLGIEVVSTGIKEASSALGGLSTSAKNAGKSVGKLTDNISKLIHLSPSLTGSGNGMATVMAQVSKSLEMTNSTVKETNKMLRDVTKRMNELETSSNRTTEAIERKRKASSVYVTTLKAMTAAAVAYLGINTAKAIVNQADAWQMMQAKLTVATGSLHNAKVAQQAIFDISQKLRQPLEATAQLYTRMAPAMQRMGKSHGDTVKVVNSVGMALKISGASAAEASSAMLQLSQSFNAGRLNGAEFSAIAEAAPKILDAIAIKAAGMGASAEQIIKVRSELKKMGSDGKITGEMMAEALADIGPEWEGQFKKLPVTVSDALTRVQNTWKQAMGQLGEDTGFNTELAKAVAQLEAIIPTVRDGLGGAFIAVMGWITANKEELGNVWKQVTGLLGDVWNVVAAVMSLGSGITTAANGMGIVSTIVFGIRLGFAGVLDALMLVGAGIMKIGGLISMHFMEPLVYIVSTVLKSLIEGVSKFTGILSAGARALGLDSIANGLEASSNAAANLATIMGDVRSSTMGGGKAMMDMADKAAAHVMSQDGAVNKLLASQQDYNNELDKTKSKVAEIDAKAWNANPNPLKPGDDKGAKAAADATKKAMKEANSELEKANKLYNEMNASLEQLQKYGLDGDKRTAAQKLETVLIERIAKATDAKAKATLQDALAATRKTIELEAHRKGLEDILTIQDDYTKKVDEASALLEAESMFAIDNTRERTTQVELAKIDLDLKKKLLDVEKAIATEEEKATVRAALTATAEKDKNNVIKRATIKATQDAEKARVKEFETSVDKMDDIFREGFADMVNNGKEGWKAFTKSLATTFKTTVVDSIYKMLLRPFVVNMVGSFMGMSDEQIVAAGGTGSKGILGTLSDIKTGFSALTGGIGASIGGFATSAGNMLGSQTLLNFGAGAKGATLAPGLAGPTTQGATGAMGWGAKAATGATYAAGAIGGHFAGRAISNGYSISGSGNGLVNTGTAAGGALGALGMIGSIGGPLGMLIGGAIAGGLNRMFGRKLKDSGIEGSIEGNSFTGNSYEFYKGGTFRSDKTKRKALDPEMQDMLSSEISALHKGFVDIGEAIGVGAEIMNGYSHSFKVSLKGLDDAEMQEEFRRKFGNIADTMAVTFVENLRSGKLESTVSEYAEDIGKELDAYRGLALEFSDETRDGAVAAWAAQLVDLAHKFDETKGYVNLFGESLDFVKLNAARAEGEDLFQTMERLTGVFATTTDVAILMGMSVEDAFGSIGLSSTAARENLVKLSGGIDALAAKTMFFAENFLPEAERMKTVQKVVSESLRDMGISANVTRAEFKKLVNDAFAVGDVNRWNKLMDIAPALDAVLDFAEGAAETAISDNSAAVDAAREALRTAYDREADALENTREKFEDLARALRKFRTDLLLGDKSPLTNEQKYLEAQSEFSRVAALALTGDEHAMSEFQSVAEEFLEISRILNASGATYTADFERVLAASQELEKFAGDQVDVATASLAVLKDQVKGLLDVNSSVLSVEQAVVNLGVALTALGDKLNPSATSSMVDSLYKSILNRDPDASGKAYWSEKIDSGVSVGVVQDSMMKSVEYQTNLLNKMYQDLLGRQADQEGLNYWLNLMQGGMSADDVRWNVQNSDEFKRLNGSHAGGLSNVPFDGYVAELHKDERVLTAQENKEYSFDRYRSGNEALVAEVKALREVVNQLKEEQREQTNNMIRANYDANNMAAQEVVEGTKDALSTSQWKDKTKVNLE